MPGTVQQSWLGFVGASSMQTLITQHLEVNPTSAGRTWNSTALPLWAIITGASEQEEGAMKWHWVLLTVKASYRQC